MKIEYLSVSKVGKVRKNNEDYLLISEYNGGYLAIVCDGLGGHKAGEVASKFAAESFVNYFRIVSEEDVLVKIRRCIEYVNKDLISLSESKKTYSGMGTTIEVLYLKDYDIFTGHVGDSAIYMKRNKDLYKLTKDHTLVQKMVDSGFIDQDMARHHPQRNVLINSLGNGTELFVDVSYLKIKKRDEWKILMCTDGVCGVLTDLIIKENMMADDIEIVSKNLEKEILEQGAPDNYSYILIANIG